MFNKAAGLTPSDLVSGGLTGDNTTDSLEALQEGQTGITAAALWAYSPRTLTQSAAAVASVLSGSVLTILRGDTLSLSMTGLGSLSGYISIDFAVKEKQTHDDNDALIRIRKNFSGLNDGLLRFNKAATDAGGGWITIDNLTSGNITITLAASYTDDLATQSKIYYDVQMITSTGVTTLTSGTGSITADVTRAIA
jgi:hypothetical protein